MTAPTTRQTILEAAVAELIAEGGDPAEILFEDWRMTVNIILWALVAMGFIYLN